MKAPVILAVDTTEDELSLALAAGGKTIVFRRRLKAPHDESLIPQVGRLLRRAGVGLDDLDAIAAASGPGRFTGIRVGMAYAAVTAAQLGIPALAVSRLEAAAFPALSRRGGPVCAVIEGYKGEKFCQFFRSAASFEPPQWIRAESWPETRRLMEGRAELIESRPGAKELLAPAAARLGRGRASRFEPLYLKPAGYMKVAR